MIRPWVNPEEVREYSQSENVKKRTDLQLRFDISRAETYVIHSTHNRFDAIEYKDNIPEDIKTAVILLAESYAKQAVMRKDGLMSSETFDDYSYTIDNDIDIVNSLGLAPLLSAYTLSEGVGKVEMKLRKL